MKISIKNKYVKNFIKHIEDELSKFNGKLILKSGVFLNSKNTDGEFSESEMTIKCNYDPSSFYWVGVLAHEYAHFSQCIKNKKEWIDFQEAVSNIKNIENIFLNKNRISKPKRLSLVKEIIKLELNADKKAIFLIKKFNLPVDKRNYISTANLIIYKYRYWAETGKWIMLKNKSNGEQVKAEEFNIKTFKKLDSYLDLNKMPKKLFFMFKDNT